MDFRKEGAQPEGGSRQFLKVSFHTAKGAFHATKGHHHTAKGHMITKLEGPHVAKGGQLSLQQPLTPPKGSLRVFRPPPAIVRAPSSKGSSFRMVRARNRVPPPVNCYHQIVKRKVTKGSMPAGRVDPQGHNQAVRTISSTTNDFFWHFLHSRKAVIVHRYQARTHSSPEDDDVIVKITRAVYTSIGLLRAKLHCAIRKMSTTLSDHVCTSQASDRFDLTAIWSLSNFRLTALSNCSLTVLN